MAPLTSKINSDGINFHACCDYNVRYVGQRKSSLLKTISWKLPKCYNYLHFTVFYQVKCALLYIKNDAEIFPAHYTWKVPKKGFQMAFMMNKLAMINSCEIILEK